MTANLRHTSPFNINISNVQRSVCLNRKNVMKFLYWLVQEINTLLWSKITEYNKRKTDRELQGFRDS